MFVFWQNHEWSKKKKEKAHVQKKIFAMNQNSRRSQIILSILGDLLLIDLAKIVLTYNYEIPFFIPPQHIQDQHLQRIRHRCRAKFKRQSWVKFLSPLPNDSIDLAFKVRNLADLEKEKLLWDFLFMIMTTLEKERSTIGCECEQIRSLPITKSMIKSSLTAFKETGDGRNWPKGMYQSAFLEDLSHLSLNDLSLLPVSLSWILVTYLFDVCKEPSEQRSWLSCPLKLELRQKVIMLFQRFRGWETCQCLEINLLLDHAIIHRFKAFVLFNK